MLTKSTTPGVFPARAPDPEEIALIRGCQEGREDSFRMLMEKYQSRVHWIAYHMLCNYDTSREIAQEAFIRVFRNIGRFDVKKSFYTWLYHITINLCIDRARRLARGRTVDIDEFRGLADPDADHPSLGLEQAETRARVQKTLNLMPPKYKALLTLREIHGFSCGEIAEIMECGNATVRWRLHRARQLFRSLWGEETEEANIASDSELSS